MLLTSQFTFPEILSLLGLMQSVYVLVYMVLRSGNVKNAIVPCLYFLFITVAFLFDAAAGRWGTQVDHYESYQWLFWFSGIPLGLLLMLQVAQITNTPPLRYFLLLLLIPIAFLPGYFLPGKDITYVVGLVLGAISLLAIWLRRDLLDGLHNSAKFGEERFWLILSLIFLNTAFLGSTLAYVSEWIPMPVWILIRTLLGIAFVYIAATSLFRIYPQAFRMNKRDDDPATLSAQDREILEKLKNLLEREKVYQDAGHGRAELAREVGTGEANLSRLVNNHYGKTIPQLLNDLRVQDAQNILKDTNIPIQHVFEESGFSSITTFNRVFKEITGESPKEYRIRFRNSNA